MVCASMTSPSQWSGITRSSASGGCRRMLTRSGICPRRSAPLLRGMRPVRWCRRQATSLRSSQLNTAIDGRNSASVGQVVPHVRRQDRGVKCDEGEVVNSAKNSLREIVGHWLTPDPGSQLRVTQFRNRRSKNECYVRIETLTAAGPVALYFFRHQDGVWRIFPPSRERPAMRAIQNSTNF
jgi:hypothetical protein